MNSYDEYKNFKDLLGQPIKVGQRFVAADEGSYEELVGRQGTITEVTSKFYRLLFDHGTASKRGRKMYHSSAVVVNIDCIKKEYPENFL